MEWDKKIPLGGQDLQDYSDILYTRFPENREKILFILQILSEKNYFEISL